MPQRSSLIFWLLLAATLAVDLAATVWMFEVHAESVVAELYFALMIAHINVLCVWVVLTPKAIRLAWVTPFLAGLIVAWLMDRSEGSGMSDKFIIYLGYNWLQTTLTLATLWLLKPTRLGATFADRSAVPKWQFSVSHLLIVMTCLAALCVLLSRSQFIAEEAVNVAALILNNVLLLIGILFAVQMVVHSLLRLAACVWCALVLAAICEFIHEIAFADSLNYFVFNIVQAIVIWSWLEWLYAQPTDDDGGPKAEHSSTQ